MNKLLVISLLSLILVIFASVMPSVVQAQYYLGLCTPNYQQRCVNNNMYWYDSCGNQGNYAGSCDYNNYNNCTYHAYRLCQGNNIYWYSGCNQQQDLVQSCSMYNQVCQYGQCVAYSIVNPVLPPVQPVYNPYFTKACSGSSLYWYDSLGVTSGLYKNCADNNSCTIDACSADKCSNTIKCDGSTCASGSADYNTYCQATQPASQCGNGLCEPNLGETTTSCPNDCKISASVNGLSISLFTKQDLNSAQWQKTADVGPNSQIYFMISATNNSTAQIDNVNILANIPMEISSLGNLQLNGVPVSGDIVSGINIGSIAPSTSKSVTFEGKTQTLSEPATKQATATSNVSGASGVPSGSDSVSITLNPDQAAAMVSNAPATSGFTGFLKHWYLWILGAVALVFLFIIVFKRLSSNV